MRDLGPRQPGLEIVRLDVKEDALAELLDGRQPIDDAGEIGAVDGELDLVQFALRRRRRRLQPREAIEAGDLAQPMNLDHASQEVPPWRLKPKTRAIQRLGIEKRARAVVADDGLARRQEIELGYARVDSCRRAFRALIGKRTTDFVVGELGEGLARGRKGTQDDDEVVEVPMPSMVGRCSWMVCLTLLSDLVSEMTVTVCAK